MSLCQSLQMPSSWRASTSLSRRTIRLPTRCSAQPDLDTYNRAPDTAPPSGSSASSSRWAPPPPPPPPPQQPGPLGLAPSRRELLFLGAGGVLGALAHTVYINTTTLNLTDPEALEGLFREALLEEEILEVKSSVSKLDLLLEELEAELAADERMIREGKAVEGRTLEEVRTAADELRGNKEYLTGLRDEMTSVVTEMTAALKQTGQ